MTYAQFHDGSFDGLLIDGDNAHIFVSTYERDRFAITTRGVVALSLGGVLAEVDLESIVEVYGHQSGPNDEVHARNSLERARNDGLTLMSVAPSYGATCLILCRSIELVTRKEWLISQRAVD